MENNKPVLAFFSHHRCGTAMILGVVQTTCQYLGLKHAHFHSPKMWEYDKNGYTLDKVAEDRDLDFVSYISADINYIGAIDKFRGFHVIRDPRDIMVSSYFADLYSHSTEYWPELIGFRKVLERLPKDEGFLENMKFTAKLRVDGWDTNLFDTIMNWDYSMPNVMEVKFEEFVNNPYQVFLDMFDFLNIIDPSEAMDTSSLFKFLRRSLQNRYPTIPFLRKNTRIPAWKLLSIVYANSFSKHTQGRKKGQENIKSHYRKGTPGDWKNHFSEQHKRYFKENYNDMLIKLGYEKDDNW